MPTSDPLAYDVFLDRFGIKNADGDVLQWGNGSNVIQYSVDNTFYNSAIVGSDGQVTLHTIDTASGQTVGSSYTLSPASVAQVAGVTASTTASSTTTGSTTSTGASSGTSSNSSSNSSSASSTNSSSSDSTSTATTSANMSTASATAAADALFGGTAAASGSSSSSSGSSGQILNPNAPAGPSTMDKIVSQLGTVTTITNMVSMWAKSVQGVATSASLSGLTGAMAGAGSLKGIQAWLGAIFNIPVVRIGLGVVGTFMSAYSAFQGIQGMFKNGISMSGIFSVGMSAVGIASSVNGLLGTIGLGTFTNPIGWAAAGAIISASVLFGAIQSIFKNGITASNFLLAAGGFVGLALAVDFAAYELLDAAWATLFGPAGWIVAGVMLLFSVLWGLFHRKPPEEIAAENFNKQATSVVWSAGPVVLVAAGTFATLFGWPQNTSPVMASITLPAYQLSQTLQNAGAAVVSQGSANSPAVYIEPAVQGQATKVMIVTPSGNDSSGNAIDTAQVYTLGTNLTFEAPSSPDGSYIPFFIYQNGKPIANPAAIQALADAQAQLRGALSGDVGALDAVRMVDIAASSNKIGARPAG